MLHRVMYIFHASKEKDPIHRFVFKKIFLFVPPVPTAGQVRLLQFFFLLVGVACACFAHEVLQLSVVCFWCAYLFQLFSPVYFTAKNERITLLLHDENTNLLPKVWYWGHLINGGSELSEHDCEGPAVCVTNSYQVY